MTAAPAANPPLPTVITINDYSPEEQIQLSFTKEMRRYSLCSFFTLILFNFIFYVIFFSVSGLVFIFPINDILPVYYDSTKADVITIFSINCIILILCILSEVKLTEIRITIKSYISWISFYTMLNLFYIFLTPILLLPIVKLLSISNCYSFKTKLNKFIKPKQINEEEDEEEEENDNEDEDDTYLRLIASHHWLSKLCYKLKIESLRADQYKANNKTIYELLSGCLDKKLLSIKDRNHTLDHNDLSFNNERYSPKNIYRDSVVKTGKTYEMKRKLFLRLYLFAINVSMIRLVFFNHNFNLKEEYFALYIAFWVRMGIEVLLVILLVILTRTNRKIGEIAKNHIGTQYYFAVLLSPEFKSITKIIFDNLEDECYSFYKYWYYELYGIDTKILLIQWIGHDTGCIIFQFLFDKDIYHDLQKEKELTIDEDVWQQIKDSVFPNNP